MITFNLLFHFACNMLLLLEKKRIKICFKQDNSFGGPFSWTREVINRVYKISLIFNFLKTIFEQHDCLFYKEELSEIEWQGKHDWKFRKYLLMLHIYAII